MANAGVIAAIAAAQQAAAWSAAVKQANAAWSSYATGRGFYFGQGRAGWGHERMPRLEGAIGNVRVALELVGSLYTAVVATPVHPLAGHVGISRAGVVSKLAGLFGARGITFDDERFDTMYETHATEPSLAHRLVGPPTRAEMIAMDAYSYSYDDGAHDEHHPVVAMYIRAIPQTADDIDRAFRVVVESASALPDAAPYR